MRRTWPDLTVLQLLVGIAEQGGLGAAARSAGIAQPNASRAIARLERQLGLTLVQRSPRGSTLTTAGTVVVHWAREVLDSADQLLVGVDALRAERSSQLTVGASMTVAEYLVPGWLGEYHRRYPDVTVNLEVHNSFDVFDRVRSGTCDVGFVEAPSVPAGLHSSTVGQDRLVVVVNPAHPWARRRRPVSASELAATSLIVREPGSGTRMTLDALIDAQRRDRAIPALELTSNAAVRISVIAGVAPAVLSAHAVRDALRSGELTAVEVEGLDLDRTLRAVWRPPRRLTGPAAELVGIARRGVPGAPRARGRSPA